MLRKNVIRHAAKLLLPMALLTACASKSPHSSPTSDVPALRPEARQPATPSICSPTCSAGLTKLRESWQRSLTSAVLPAGSASAATTR
ncbi:putative gp23 [Burkholderia ambifaria AMMD]|nr:putative gp23 [Burkholderia ambifaria AMMD]